MSPARRTQDASGGGPPPPSIEDLVAVDEGPMRRDLLAQIASLERTISKFLSDNAPFEPLPEGRRRGPAVLSTEQLEQVRDELHATLVDLEALVASRMARNLGPDLLSTRPARLRRLFARRRAR